MRVHHVSIIPTEGAKAGGNIALTPELLAATGARYSRNNEGLESIVAKIDWAHTDKSVDAIFRMIDYGHASIADMAPVAMFIDDISLFAAYYLWAHASTASGQESSTRYIQMDESGVMTPEELGISDHETYLRHVQDAFAHYQAAVTLWSEVALRDPAIMQIPTEIIQDTSEKGQKKLARMRRNYAFDRARVFLPVCARTNMMMVMSARSWVELISLLLSHPLHELQKIGDLSRAQLDLATPRLTKHARAKDETRALLTTEFIAIQQHKDLVFHEDDGAYLSLFEKDHTDLTLACGTRTNRYSLFGDEVRMMGVRFGWRHIALAELRDLNRHRTGQKQSILKPNGFYVSIDQAPSTMIQAQLTKLATFGAKTQSQALATLDLGDETYIYQTLLGHTYEFEHITTLDKYIYEAELRTGVGAHYRYAYHLHNTLEVLYTLHPELRGVVIEGRGEPE